ncbi:MAG: hypothetical protein PHS19_06945 [Eubacteriales bacterium]|nr:hypothetical protein [Eubacteriales bacterium]
MSAKLNSNQGASFIIALIYFLVAGVVAALIITSAVTNASKIENRAENEEAYQAASHVAEVLCGELEDMEYVYDKNGNVTQKPINPPDSKEFLIGDYITEQAYNICYNSDVNPPAGKAVTFTEDTGEADKAIVEVYVQMDGQFNLACLVHATYGSGSYDITVFTGASILDESDTEISHDVDKSGDEYNDISENVETKTISWQGSKISKGNPLEIEVQ